MLSYNKITDIEPLASKPNLTTLLLYRNDVKDITPLYNNLSLQLLGVKGRGKVPCKQIDGIRKQLSPDAKIWGQNAC